MTSIKILWVDDEIELLKPHFLFLEDKGYQTTASKSGQDALLLLQNQTFDVVLLDENMPGWVVSKLSMRSNCVFLLFL